MAYNRAIRYLEKKFGKKDPIWMIWNLTTNV